MSPKLSIITVTYNAAEFIEPTILSVGEQTFDGLEYVIVDGMSKDDTVAIIERHPDKVTRYISEPDKGLYDAMNKAIDLAKGEYVMFLNAGDLLQSATVIQELFDEAEGQDILYGDTTVIDKDYNYVGMRHLTPPEKLSWKSFQKGMVICHQAIVCKRAICPKYDTRYRIAADIDWAIRLTKAAKSSYFFKHSLVQFMQDGISTELRSVGLKERYKVMTEHYGRFTTLWNNVKLGLKYFLTFRFIQNVRK